MSVAELKIWNIPGKVEKPGKKVRQKACFNRTIGDQRWGLSAKMLRYKPQLRGGLLIGVDPQHASRHCPSCGFTHQMN
jgi:putative transposase